MINSNSTASIMTIASIMVLSSLTLTPTVPINNNPTAFVQNSNIDFGTGTICSKTAEVASNSFYDEAISLFHDMRDFTAAELAQYNESMNKLFKSTGLNLSDLC